MEVVAVREGQPSPKAKDPAFPPQRQMTPRRDSKGPAPNPQRQRFASSAAAVRATDRRSQLRKPGTHPKLTSRTQVKTKPPSSSLSSSPPPVAGSLRAAQKTDKANRQPKEDQPPVNATARAPQPMRHVVRDVGATAATCSCSACLGRCDRGFGDDFAKVHGL